MKCYFSSHEFMIGPLQVALVILIEYSHKMFWLRPTLSDCGSKIYIHTSAFSALVHNLLINN